MSKQSEQKVTVEHNSSVGSITQIVRLGLPTILIISVMAMAVVIVSGYDLKTVLVSIIPPTPTATSPPTATTIPTLTSTPTLTATPTPTFTPQPTNTPTGIPTETPGPLIPEAFPNHKLGVLITNFGEGPDFFASAQGEDVAEFFSRSLSYQIRQAGLGQVVVERARVTIRSEAEAKELGKVLNATIIVWGRVGSKDKVLFPNFTLLKVLEAAPSIEEADFNIYYTPLNSSETVSLSNELASRTSVLASFVIGLIHMSNRDYEQAVNEFTRTIKLAEGKVDTDVLYDYRGRAYYGVLDFKLASEDFERALSLNPNNPSLYVGLGIIYYREQDWTKATELYQQALRLQPDYARAYQGLGAVSAVQGDYQTAIEYYKQAVTYKEGYALAYYSLGSIYLRLDNKEEAITAYENCLRFVGTNEKLKFAAEQNLLLAKATATPTLTPTLILPTPQVAFPTQRDEVQRALDTASESPTSEDKTAPNVYLPPRLIYPLDDMVVVGGLLKFEWEWERQLRPDEYFELKIYPPVDDLFPVPVFVDRSKGSAYLLDVTAARLVESTDYVWTIH